MENAAEVFKEEAIELLEELTSALLELEESPEDKEGIGRAFRALHTIKGSGAMFGFEEVASFTHDIETVFDKLRDGALQVSQVIIDIGLAAVDVIRVMIDPAGGAIDATKKNMIETGVAQLLQSTEEQAETETEKKTEEPAQTEAKMETSPVDESLQTYRVRFRPAADIFQQDADPLELLDELGGMGDCTVVAVNDSIPALADMQPEVCYTYWDILLTTDRSEDEVRDVFIFVEENSEVQIEVVDEDAGSESTEYKKLGEILVERGDVRKEEVSETLQNQKPLGQMLVETGTIQPSAVESALAEQHHVREQREKKQQVDTKSSVRVEAGKLDKLVDLVGEMVTVQARLTQIASGQNVPDLTLISEEIERLTAELRDNTMNIRMLPIGTAFSKFKRVVRDLSRELGKEVTLTTEGAETELDKNVIEQMGDPMVHIIRNCIDHGIERPEVREAIGKDRKGTIHVSARHSGAHVLIQVSDDGAGIDKGAVLAKAEGKGIVAPDSQLSDKEIFDLLFAPGFSTAAQVTSVSGRGVGMDVVKRNIDALGGTVELTSQKEKGTTLSLKLPLTLAIIDSLLVKVAHAYYALPHSLVLECIELTREDVEASHGRDMSNVRGELVPYISLREQFSLNGAPPQIEQIVICEIDDTRIGFVVDHVIGGHQTVIKTLGRMYKNIEGVSGATILGDGTVALIIDPVKLARQVQHEYI